MTPTCSPEAVTLIASFDKAGTGTSLQARIAAFAHWKMRQSNLKRCRMCNRTFALDAAAAVKSVAALVGGASALSAAKASEEAG
jgi:hypothetical protein